LSRLACLRTTLALALVLASALASCTERCEPVLCISGECDASIQKLIPEGDVVIVQYALPAGIVTEEKVRFRIETPCACVTFTRTPRTGEDVVLSGETKTAGGGTRGGESDEEDASSCEYEPPLEIAIPMPKGGTCRLTVTAELLNDTRTVTLEGGECEALACDPDLKCADDLSEEPPAPDGGSDST
jgi:hypothetical protein